jgi:alpha-glucosidase
LGGAVAEIYRDGDQADYRTEHPFDLVTENLTVTAGDTLDLRPAQGKGQDIRLVPKP